MEENANDWLTVNDHPQGMLWTLRNQFKVTRTNAGRRKLRLFAIAGCYLVRDKLPEEPELWANVELAERFVEGQAGKEELKTGWERTRKKYFAWGDGSLAPDTPQVRENIAVAMAMDVTQPEVFSPAFDQTAYQVRLAGYREGKKDGNAILCDLIREVFGNPWSRVTLEKSWRTSAVKSLAKSIYEERNFIEMSILADALEDAGCDNAEILEHCRDSDRHVRGCWVIDLILGNGLKL